MDSQPMMMSDDHAHEASSSSASVPHSLNHPLPSGHQMKDGGAEYLGQLITTFTAILDEKLSPIYDILHHHREQMDRLETLLTSVVTIKYPELKRRGMLPSTPVHHAPAPSTPSSVTPLGLQTPTHAMTPQGNELVSRMDDDDDEHTPQQNKRRRIYSHDISSKINTMLEPLFEENWKITRERERELGERLAREIGVESSEGMQIVKSFWHRSRGNSKRLFTQLDDYRQGLEVMQQFEPAKKAEAMRRFRIDSEDVIIHDLNDVNQLLETMKKKGSGRTAAKTPKPLRRVPDTGLKTFKGRAAALCNHFYHMVHNGGYEALPPAENDLPMSAQEHHEFSQSMQTSHLMDHSQPHGGAPAPAHPIAMGHPAAHPHPHVNMNMPGHQAYEVLVPSSSTTTTSM